MCISASKLNDSMATITGTGMLDSNVSNWYFMGTDYQNYKMTIFEGRDDHISFVISNFGSTTAAKFSEMPAGKIYIAPLDSNGFVIGDGVYLDNN